MSHPPTARTPGAAEFPFAAADLCVKCGLCLPYCPTYLENGHEGDSPRGRISLMQGFASGAVPVTASLEAHLDGCLACRACERACPVKVPYGLLIDEGRALLAQHRPARTRFTRVTGALLSTRTGVLCLAAALWLYRTSGLQHLVRATHLLGRGRLARLESLIPQRRALPHATAPAARNAERVSLFTGCVGRLLDDETLAAARAVLGRLGCAVDAPPQQTCCGAIHQHGGLPEAATRNAERNLDAFADSASVIYSASGCGATLVEYPRLSSAREADTQAFTAKLEDLSSAVLRRWRDDLALRPLPARVAVHLPCTQRNVLGTGEATLALLRRIPGIELVELDATQRCCGAAGTYFVTQPGMADALLERKLRGVDALQPDYIVSSNIGCSLHLAGGLQRRDGKRPEVLHPVALLARQLAD